MVKKVTVVVVRICAAKPPAKFRRRKRYEIIVYQRQKKAKGDGRHPQRIAA
jgi:hypothetical protein